VYLRECVCAFMCVSVCACMCACVRAFADTRAYVYMSMSRTGSYLLPDGTNMCLSLGKDGVTKIHEVSVDLGFVHLQVAC